MHLQQTPHLVEAFRTVRNLIDTQPSMLEQAVLADFIAEGPFTRHLRKMRSLSAERRAALIEAAIQGVDIAPISHFSIEPVARNGILLGYSDYSVEQILDGIRRLAMAMDSI